MRVCHYNERCNLLSESCRHFASGWLQKSPPQLQGALLFCADLVCWVCECAHCAAHH